MSLALIPGVGEPELYAICAAVATAVVSWIVYAVKLKRRCTEFATALDRQQSEAEAALSTVQRRAAEEQAKAQKNLSQTTLKLSDVEKRFATHRDVADRRQTDASMQITRLETELATTREVAAQLVPTQSRIKDLETALSAEQGRVQAQEQAIQATNARASDFEKRLVEAQDMVMKHKAEMQEHAAEAKKLRDEYAAYLAAGGAEAELAKARETNQQAETKITNLQRSLKAAEARVEMVQKEFMSAVGVASAPVSGASASASGSEKKVRDLEEKITQLEAEARKRAREDGYKIAELEYRLIEAVESARQPQPSAPVVAPPSEPLSGEIPPTPSEVASAEILPLPATEPAPPAVTAETAGTDAE